MENDETKKSLETIFRMMTPTISQGVQTDLSKKTVSQNSVSQMLKILYGAPACGALTFNDLISRVEQIQIKSDQNQKSEIQNLNKSISILGPNSKLTNSSNLTWPYMYYNIESKQNNFINGTSELFTNIAIDNNDVINRVPFSILTVNNKMITPQRRDAEKVEIFLNSIPSIVMSRCVPYAELEFGFIRPGEGEARTQFQTTSLLKFLLGGDTNQQSTSTQAMIDARRTVDKDQSGDLFEKTTAGMELFTSPQTLVNLDASTNAFRYVNVIDPIRPFATLKNIVIDVKPTVGTYSYKKATVQFILHDRSRLSEIADLVRPQVYTQTTVWLTYGWRHPNEPGIENPYATFINNNMIKREAYGIQNVQFSFDHFGQVDVRLELYTKGTSEIRTTKISQNLKSYQNIQKSIQTQIETISRLRKNLNLYNPADLSGYEVRAISLLDSIEKGSLPDITKNADLNALNTVLKNLENQLKKGNSGSKEASELIDVVKDIIGTKGKKDESSFKELKDALQSSIENIIKDIKKSPDPYLMFEEKAQAYESETGTQHPYALDKSILGILTQDVKSSAVVKKQSPTPSATPGQTPAATPPADDKPNVIKQQRKYASFAKVFTSFIGNSIMTIPGIDEVQTYFYPFNSHAGHAANTNIAEFPVDIDIFAKQYDTEIQQKSTDVFTIEEFMNFLINSQIGDMRSLAYGFQSDFDKLNTTQEQKKKFRERSKDQDYYAQVDQVSAKIGKFQKPEVEVFMETTYAVAGSSSDDVDVLSAFNSMQQNGKSSQSYKRILRIHVFDKTLNPYEQATTILSDPTGAMVAIDQDQEDEFKQFLYDLFKQSNTKVVTNNQVKIITSKGVKQLFKNAEVIREPNSSVSNQKIKEFVARYIPSITYGTNASTVNKAELATTQDPLLTAAQLTGLNKNKSNVMSPNGSGVGGLPLRVIPAKLSMTTMGCPLLNYMQLFFVDFSTGTSLDNVYGITGMIHTITPGKFDSQLTFAFYDAYGKFDSSDNSLEALIADVSRKLADDEKKAAPKNAKSEARQK